MSPRAAWATEEAIQRFTAMWTAGDSVNVIGAALGVSKNAIAGMRTRLDLPARPSPIRTDTKRANAILLGVAARNNKPTLPPLLSDPGGTLRTALTPPRTASALVRHLAPMPPLAAELPLRDAPRVARVSGRGECCWPIGMPRTPAFRLCDAPTAGRRSYCDEHSKLAFVKIRDRREDAGQPAHASTGGD